MRASFPNLLLGLAIFVSGNASATVRYVDANSATPTVPYTSWATAATNIQAAVQISFAGDLVLVTNGVYEFGGSVSGGSNRVTVSTTITLQSVNGPTVTIIKGHQVSGTTNGVSAVRCAYLANGAILSGFTLTNGATASGEFGGGVKCQTVAGCLVTNCIITGNTTILSWGGGAYFSALTNCSVLGNSAASSGGGSGGGVANGTAVDCVLAGNWCGYICGAAITSTLINCTVVSNWSGAYGGPLDNCTLKNCIDYYNFAYTTTPDSGTGNFTNCCVFPAQATGANNVTNPPTFVDLAAGDFHLSGTSPCINAGNNSFITVTNDFDGNPRVVGGSVDIGAYEFQYQSLGTFYVNISNAQPVFPFQTWDSAATNIQDAINAASSGSQILVSNGVYKTGGRVVYGSLTNRVVVNRSLTIQSVNGAAVTTIFGFQGAAAPYGNGAIRCIYLTNGVVLDGFTLTNGATRSTGLVAEQSGAGIWCESTNALIRNCVISKNVSYNSGGGVYSGTLTNCAITDNQSGYGGGGGGGANSSTLDHCTLLRNHTASTAGASGGGAIFSLLNFCLVSNNVSVYPGGGVASSTLNCCRLIGNSTTFYEGGGAASSTLNNCLVVSNSTPGNGGGTSSSTLTNCTVVANSAGQRGGGTYAGTLFNCIVYYNTAQVQGSNYNNYYTSVFGNICCTIPAPGANVITNMPVFEALSGLPQSYHLQPYSPCINNGDNACATGTTDLDGNPRIVADIVDIGAYEHPHPGLVLPYFWAQQYGLPTYGYYDSDGDGLNNWQEWKAGTNPTNAASVLTMNSAATGVSGATVTWQSVSGVTYYVQRSSDLTDETFFSTIQSNIVGQAVSTSCTDTTATNAGPYFYRVGVQ